VDVNCIKCGEGTSVSTTYQNVNGVTRRRRICLHCDFRFTTREAPDSGDVERAEREKKAPNRSDRREKGVDRLSHAWYNPSPTNATIED
jgi:transcriptional regulator NrdR family protein